MNYEVIRVFDVSQWRLKYQDLCSLTVELISSWAEKWDYANIACGMEWKLCLGEKHLLFWRTRFYEFAAKSAFFGYKTRLFAATSVRPYTVRNTWATLAEEKFPVLEP